MIGCSTHRDDVDAYVDGELAPEALTRFAAHLGACDACREAIDARARLETELRALPRTEVSPQFEAQFWARLARSQEAAVPWWRRLPLVPAALGTAAVGAVAIALFVGNPSVPDEDLGILAVAEDFDLLLDDDHEVVMALEELEGWNGTEES